MLVRVRLRSAACSMLLMLACVAGGGCQWMAAPWLMWGAEPTRTVRAEYPYLADRRICTLVWVDTETLFSYPNVQLELAEFVNSAIGRTVRGVSFAPTQDVIQMQRREPDWRRTHPTRIGRRFGADRVLMIEVTRYGVRDPQNPHLLRGTIHANVKVYDTAYPDSQPTYKSEIETAYPPDSHGRWDSDERTIRRGAMESFADEVARKFHDHKVKVR